MLITTHSYKCDRCRTKVANTREKMDGYADQVRVMLRDIKSDSPLSVARIRVADLFVETGYGALLLCGECSMSLARWFVVDRGPKAGG